MKPTHGSRYFIAGIVAAYLLVAVDVSLAIDPKYDIDLKQLRPVGKDVRKNGRKDVSGMRSPAVTGAAAAAGRKADRPGAGQPAKAAAKRHSHRKTKKAGHGIRKKGRTWHVRRGKPADKGPNGAGTLKLSFRLPVAGGDGRDETLLQARNLWDRIVPGESERDDKISLHDRSFSLALDPAAYPVFRDSEGGRIVVDAAGALSPEVKAIIEENDSTVHIVKADPSDPKRFYSTLLGAARFYSVEEGFTFSFGADPLVTVNADFKVERTADSLLSHDVVLLNVTDRLMGMPPALCTLLSSEGFRVVDAGPASPRPKDRVNRLYAVKGSDQQATVDSLLTAASVAFEKDREITLDDGSRSGVVLTAKAERLFRENGNKVVVSFSRNDPIQQALMRMLQRNGYYVVTILPDDGFRSIAGKLAPVLKQPARYGSHYLWSPKDAPFAMRMSGVEIAAPGRTGGAVFVTDAAIDPMTSDLLGFMGYDVIGR